MSLQRRMALAIGGIVALLVIAGGLFTWTLVERNLRGNVDDLLITEAAAVESIGADLRSDVTLEQGTLTPLVDRLDELAIRIRIFPADGLPLEGQTAPFSSEALQHTAATGRDTFDTVTLDGRRHRVLSRALPIAIVQLATDVEPMESGLASLRRGLILWGAGGVVLAGFAGWLLARRLARPVADVATAATRIADLNELPDEIVTNRSDEIGDLARSFNALVEALALSRAQQERLAADTGHELRTPLTSLRTTIEFLDQNPALDPAKRQSALHGAAIELEALGALVDELVDLASVGTLDEQWDPIDLAALMDQVAARTRLATGRPVEVVSSGTVTAGRASLVRRALSSLVDNADRYSPAGAPIEISESRGRLEVRDHGPGIRAEDRPFAFQRFYRSAHTQEPGTGIGLAIVRQAAEAHGGEVWIRDAPDGGAIVGFSVIPPDASVQSAADPHARDLWGSTTVRSNHLERTEMPRLHQVSREEADSPIVEVMYDLLFGERDPVAEPGTDTGTPGDWWTAFANAPAVLDHAVRGFALYQSDDLQLDPVLRELGQARAGYAAGSQFVFSQHCKSLRGLGVSDERIEAIAVLGSR